MASSGKNEKSDSKITLSEGNKQLLFALLALAALAVAAYVLFLSEAPDAPSQDGSEFYYALVASEKVGILYDVRGASDAQTSAIYQCGVDMISKGRFAGKTLYNIGCDSAGCISTATGTNGSNSMTFDQAKKKLSQMPYLLIARGDTSTYKFYQRHMEILVGKDYNASYNVTSCDISATIG